MKSSLLLLSSASVAVAAPLFDVVLETELVYYTVNQEVASYETAPVGSPAVPWVTDAATYSPYDYPILPTEIPVITITVEVTETATAVAAENTLFPPRAPSPVSSPATNSSSNTTVDSASSTPVSIPATSSSSSTTLDGASSTFQGTSNASPTDFAGTATHHHNIHRTNNSAPSMTWGDVYASYASTVAASCVFAHNLTPGGGGYGQNIAMYASTNAQSMTAELAIAQAATQMWYNGEINLYPSNSYGSTPSMTNFEAWGHYSQMVWVDSTVLGCASQYCAPGTMVASMGAWYSVCNYYPAGNIDGQYIQNVLAPGNAATVTVDVGA